jgi:hypothetical protein
LVLLHQSLSRSAGAKEQKKRSDMPPSRMGKKENVEAKAGAAGARLKSKEQKHYIKKRNTYQDVPLTNLLS